LAPYTLEHAHIIQRTSASRAPHNEQSLLSHLTLVTTRFHDFFCLLPDFRTLGSVAHSSGGRLIAMMTVMMMNDNNGMEQEPHCSWKMTMMMMMMMGHHTLLITGRLCVEPERTAKLLLCFAVVRSNGGAFLFCHMYICMNQGFSVCFSRSKGSIKCIKFCEPSNCLKGSMCNSGKGTPWASPNRLKNLTIR